MKCYKIPIRLPIYRSMSGTCERLRADPAAGRLGFSFDLDILRRQAFRAYQSCSSSLSANPTGCSFGGDMEAIAELWCATGTWSSFLEIYSRLYYTP